MRMTDGDRAARACEWWLLLLAYGVGGFAADAEPFAAQREEARLRDDSSFCDDLTIDV
jgi:hypothetical protein